MDPEFEVMISFNEGDHELAFVISESLKVFGIDTNAFQWITEAGFPSQEVYTEMMDNSRVLIPILSASGNKDPLVRESIGYFVAKEKDVVPISKRGKITQGLLEGLQAVDFYDGDNNWVIYEVIREIRNFVRREYNEDLAKMKIYCEKCEQYSENPTPASETLHERVRRREYLYFVCRNCQNNLTVDPRTLLPIEDTDPDDEEPDGVNTNGSEDDSPDYRW